MKVKLILIMSQKCNLDSECDFMYYCNSG